MARCSVVTVWSLVILVLVVGCALLVAGGVLFALESEKLAWQRSSCTVLDQSSYTIPNCSTEFSSCTGYTTVFNVTWLASSNSTEWREVSSDVKDYRLFNEGDTMTCYYDIQEELVFLHPGNTEPGFNLMMIGSGLAGVALLFIIGFGAYLGNQRDKKPPPAPPTRTWPPTVRRAPQPVPELDPSDSSEYYSSSSPAETMASVRETPVEEPEAGIAEEVIPLSLCSHLSIVFLFYVANILSVLSTGLFAVLTCIPPHLWSLLQFSNARIELPRREGGKRRIPEAKAEMRSYSNASHSSGETGEALLAEDPSGNGEEAQADGEVDVEVGKEEDTDSDVPVY